MKEFKLTLHVDDDWTAEGILDMATQWFPDGEKIVSHVSEAPYKGEEDLRDEVLHDIKLLAQTHGYEVNDQDADAISKTILLDFNPESDDYNDYLIESIHKHFYGDRKER